MAQVARLLQLSTATVYALCERGALSHHRLPGNAIRVNPGDLEAFLEGTHQAPVTGSLRAKPEHSDRVLRLAS